MAIIASPNKLFVKQFELKRNSATTIVGNVNHDRNVARIIYPWLNSPTRPDRINTDRTAYSIDHGMTRPITREARPAGPVASATSDRSNIR